jgi:hypothetical protein
MLCGCGRLTGGDIVIDEKSYEQIDKKVILVARTGEKKKLYIPDPKSYVGNDKIILPNESLLSKEKNLCIDMSFLGFAEDAQLVAWGSGNILALQPGMENIKYEFDENGSTVSGNCIILSITDKKDENYLILLDYINGKSSVINTNLQLTSKITKRPKMKFADLTSDGLEELILTNVPDGYKSGTICEIYRFDSNGNEWKNIYKEKGDYLSGTLEQEYFECELRDNYEALVKCNKINYSETISLLDAGFEIKDLEISYKPKDDMIGSYFYKNGRVIEKGRLHISHKKEDEGVLLLDDETLREKKVHFRYILYLERYHNVGEIDAQLYYDKIADYLEIQTATISVG